MISLRTSLSALAFFAPGQLLKFPMKFFHLPTHLKAFNHPPRRVQFEGAVVCYRPFNVAEGLRPTWTISPKTELSAISLIARFANSLHPSPTLLNLDNLFLCLYILCDCFSVWWKMSNRSDVSISSSPHPNTTNQKQIERALICLSALALINISWKWAFLVLPSCSGA